MNVNIPRVVIAGLGGDSGKTLVSCGLLAHCRREELNPLPFKKGPDYIDPAWLGLAAGKQCRNLDTYMIGREESKRIFSVHIQSDGIAIIEGNRGLFDGADDKGTHSTAELAKLLGASVVLVIDGTKVTRTLAAIVLGCQMMDSSLRIGGVILNNVSGKRHARVAVDSIQAITGIPVIGIIKKYKNTNLLPSRHLGLVTPKEHKQALSAVETAADIIEDSINFDKFFEIANNYEDILFAAGEKKSSANPIVKLGYFVDRAFSFYYPDNLEALENAGAELIKLSAISDSNLPALDGLYIGGGFPETNLKALSDNKDMMKAVKYAASNGMPIYAECGGLMYLSKSIVWNADTFEMCGVFPFSVEMNVKPQGHGYVEASADIDNPFFNVGEKIRGHEFHYSGIINNDAAKNTVLSLSRGKGAVSNRDGFMTKNTFASYLHIHSASAINWANNFIKIASKYRK